MTLQKKIAISNWACDFFCSIAKNKSQIDLIKFPACIPFYQNESTTSLFYWCVGLAQCCPHINQPQKFSFGMSSSLPSLSKNSIKIKVARFSHKNVANDWTNMIFGSEENQCCSKLYCKVVIHFINIQVGNHSSKDFTRF